MNVLAILIIVVIFVLIIYSFFFSKDKDDAFNLDTDDINKFSEENICSQVVDGFDEILQTDYSALNLNKFETLKNERNRDKLRASLKNCSHGNESSKLYVKDYIKDFLQRRLGVTAETVDLIIPFSTPERLTRQDKFEMLLYGYKVRYDVQAFAELIVKNSLDEARGEGIDIHYEITSMDIDEVFAHHRKMIDNLDFYDKLNIVTQRIYQRTYGHGVVDEIRDMIIDGLNCGTSGIPSTFYMHGSDAMLGAEPGELPRSSCNAIWVMFHGKLIHLSFLGFKTDRELERVAKLVYRYNSPGTLDASTGKIVNYMQDGCRVVVARPPFAEAWMFFIRKFDATSKMTLQELYPFEGNEKLIETIRWLTSGSRNIAITGEQFTGKSTLLASLVQFIPRSFSIRVQEMAFELFLRKLYTERNIGTFRETATVSAEAGIDFSKKTDGTVGVFGEIAQAAVAALAILMGQVGMSQVIFTHHAKTVEDLVEAFRNNMIEAAGYNNEEIVEKTVARVLNFNIHISRMVNGKRYISRITEIIVKGAEDYPDSLEAAMKEYFYRTTDRKLFESRDILIFKDGKYLFNAIPTDYSIEEIKKRLSITEVEEFDRFLTAIHKEVDTYAFY